MLASRGRGRWIGAYHKQATSRKPFQTAPHQVSEPALHLISGDSAPDRLAHDESHQRWCIGIAHAEMGDQGGTAGASPSAYRVGELIAPSHARDRRQHRTSLRLPPPAGVESGGRGRLVVRRSARHGPCAAGRRGWPGRPWYACGAGNRGSSRGDGCSAGKYACSRVGSQASDTPALADALHSKVTARHMRGHAK
jgi:hypothetical protein